MKLTKLMVNTIAVATLGLGAAGVGMGAASAQPGAPLPQRPGNNINQPCFPFCENRHDDWNNNNFQRGDWNNNNNFQRGDSDRGAWWANNRHDWWDDRQGMPPWGWNLPPAYQWTGGPPHPFNYWGYDVNPVWDDGFHQWGIWLFGLWIPILGLGVS
jgi:hypothetical protein